MRILYYRKVFKTNMSMWQKYHIYSDLEHHNCEIVEFNILDFKSILEANNKLLDLLQNERVDLFVTPLNENYIFISTVEQIKRMNIKTLLICFDNLVVPFEHKKIAKYFDIVWLTSYETKYLFDKYGAKTVFMPYASSPFSPFCYSPSSSLIRRVAFVGTPYGSRANIINYLVNNGIKVDLYYSIQSKKTVNIYEGKEQFRIQKSSIHVLMEELKFKEGRKIVRGKLANMIKKSSKLDVNNPNLTIFSSVNLAKMSEIYNKYTLLLSFCSCRNTDVLKKPLNIVNLRSFEIPMCGGVQICLYNDELANYFEDEKEIIFYRNKEELLNKCIFYLSRTSDELINEIRKNARLRAEKEHTWYNRFKKIFDILGLEE